MIDFEKSPNMTPAELVEALGQWRESHGPQAHTYQLAGALRSLARTVAGLADREEFDILTRRVQRLQESDADQNAALDRLIFPPRANVPAAVEAARVAAHNLTTAQVNAAREARGMTGAHDLTPGKAATRGDVALFVLGLRELRDMVQYARTACADNPHDRERIACGSLQAIQARIGGMLDAWGAELSAMPPPAE